MNLITCLLILAVMPAYLHAQTSATFTPVPYSQPTSCNTSSQYYDISHLTCIKCPPNSIPKDGKLNKNCLLVNFFYIEETYYSHKSLQLQVPEWLLLHSQQRWWFNQLRQMSNRLHTVSRRLQLRSMRQRLLELRREQWLSPGHGPTRQLLCLTNRRGQPSFQMHQVQRWHLSPIQQQMYKL